MRDVFVRIEPVSTTGVESVVSSVVSAARGRIHRAIPDNVALGLVPELCPRATDAVLAWDRDA